MSRVIGFFVESPAAAVVLVGLLILGGLSTSPFDHDYGGIPRERVPVDAIPDVGENQQIVFTEWAGRSPRDVEDQVTYPLTTALLGMPGVRTVRSSSMLGFSTIYVIFEDDVEFYWARSRVLEKLAALPPDTLPPDATPTLGPDATALGQVYWYTLEGHDEDGALAGGWALHELRALQDFTVRYALQSVPGVAEVASIGGHVREYQVDVDPEALAAADLRLDDVVRALRGTNLDVGARTLEVNRVEYLVRGLGLVQDLSDLESTVIASREQHPDPRSRRGARRARPGPAPGSPRRRRRRGGRRGGGRSLWRKPDGGDPARPRQDRGDRGRAPRAHPRGWARLEGQHRPLLRSRRAHRGDPLHALVSALVAESS